jgi:hypothetical protein
MGLDLEPFFPIKQHAYRLTSSLKIFDLLPLLNTNGHGKQDIHMNFFRNCFTHTPNKHGQAFKQPHIYSFKAKIQSEKRIHTTATSFSMLNTTEMDNGITKSINNRFQHTNRERYTQSPIWIRSLILREKFNTQLELSIEEGTDMDQ